MGVILRKLLTKGCVITSYKKYISRSEYTLSVISQHQTITKIQKIFRHCQIKRELFSVDIRIFYVHEIGFCGHITWVVF